MTTVADPRRPVTVPSGVLGAGMDWPLLTARRHGASLPDHIAPGPDALSYLPDPVPARRRAAA